LASTEKNFLYWADYREAKAGQKSLVPARRAHRTNQGKDSYHLYSFIVSVSAVRRGHLSLDPCFLHSDPSTASPSQNA
jgi:hypothetical protein